MANICGHNHCMTVSVAQAKADLPRLIRAVEEGESILITRHGKAVARLVGAPPASGQVVLGGMRDRIKLLPGWDAPVDPDRFLEGDL